MYKDEIDNEYFSWLYNIVAGRRFAKGISYTKVLFQLHDTEFRWTIPKDKNRAGDGIELRRRYSMEMGFDPDYFDDYLDGPCSIFEMMVALAIRCEETIMDDPSKGDRTSHWFWEMLTSLGLGSMDNSRYDPEYVDDVTERFLSRDYDPNGCGGLFTIRNCKFDLRETEIWIQLLWYLDTIT